MNSYKAPQVQLFVGVGFLFFLMWYKNREMHIEFNSYGPKSISV